MELVWTTNATSSPGIKPYAMPISHVNGKSNTKRIATAAQATLLQDCKCAASPVWPRRATPTQMAPLLSMASLLEKAKTTKDGDFTKEGDYAKDCGQFCGRL